MITGMHLLLACATCYGDPNAPMTNGANMAILTLLGVTAVVLTGCAAFMVQLARRARQQPPFPAGPGPILKETRV